MTKQDQTGPGGIAAALAVAQAQMGKAIKQSDNPHFRSKYADLGAVMDACMPALNANGIAVVQPPYDDETGRYVKTVLYHDASGESLECRVPLIVAKNDMQGYGSAVTYARRYGLMAMAGIAPEDDDGNAAAKNPPRSVSAEQFTTLRDLIEDAGADTGKFLKAFGAVSLEQFPADSFDRAQTQLRRKITANKESADA